MVICVVEFKIFENHVLASRTVSIAGLPDLTELRLRRRWYRSRPPRAATLVVGVKYRPGTGHNRSYGRSFITYFDYKIAADCPLHII